MAQRDPTKRPTPDWRGPLALLAVLALLGWLFYPRGGSWTGGAGSDEREVRDGELGSLGHGMRGAGDAGPGGGPSDPDAGRVTPMHPRERPAEISEPQVPGPQADPESSDPGPGEEFIARYEGRSGRLSPHASTDSTQTSVPQRSRMAPPNVAAWIESHIAVPGEPVLIHGMVLGARGEPVTPATMTLTIFRTEPGDGADTPMRRGDVDYVGRYTPTLETHPTTEDGRPAQVQFLVRATGTYQGQEYSRSVTSWFLLSSPGAHADFSRPDIAREGPDLVMRVPVQVSQPGTYYGYAELWGGHEGGQPIAFARERRYLDMTASSYTFLFGGAIIAESNLDGPYTIRNARFMGVDTSPPHEQPPVDVVSETPAWPASSFH